LRDDLLVVGVLPMQELLTDSRRLGAVMGWIVVATLFVTVTLVAVAGVRTGFEVNCRS